MLDEVAASLASQPGWQLTIEGHTDSTGTPGHNQTLSEQRAAAVKVYLVAAGIETSRLDTVGFGQLAAGGRQRHRARSRPEPPRRARPEVERLAAIGSRHPCMVGSCPIRVLFGESRCTSRGPSRPLAALRLLEVARLRLRRRALPGTTMAPRSAHGTFQTGHQEKR